MMQHVAVVHVHVNQVTWQKKWEEEEGMNNLNNQ